MGLKLRPYQEDMKREIYAAWAAGRRNVLLVMPTGLGKTKTFCSIAIDKAVAPASGKLPTAIMVHRKELVQQISLTLAEEGIAHNIIAPRPVILGIVAAQRQLLKRQFYDYAAAVTVISVDTLVSRIAKHEKWARSVKLWITDEAAHVLRDNKWGRAVGFFPGAIGLGVTATPERLDKKGLGRHADGVFDAMVEGPNSRWGIENGYLSKYKIALPSSDYQQYLRKASDGADYARAAMAQASAKSRIVGDAVANYLKFAKGKQAIYFCTDVKAGEKMEAEFLKQGVAAKLLTAETDDKRRLQAIVDFRERRIQALLNIDLFDEGFDVPGIEVVGMCRPTMSKSKHFQMLGRGLRPMAGKDHCLIIDHVGNVARHGFPDRAHRWTLDRIARRKDKQALIRTCFNPDCSAPFERHATACPYCGLEVKRPAGSGAGRVGPAQVDGDLFLLDPETLKELDQAARLEDPGSVARRVSRAAGAAAGIKAMKNQAQRIEAAKALGEAIARWAGRQRAEGLSDRSIHKKFYLERGKTINQAMAEPRAEMLETIKALE